MTKKELLNFYYNNFVKTDEGFEADLEEAFQKYLQEEISIIKPEGSYSISIYTHKFSSGEGDEWFEYSIYNNDCTELEVGYNSKENKYKTINLCNIDMFTHADKISNYIHVLQEMDTAIDNFIQGLKAEEFDADININVEF